MRSLVGVLLAVLPACAGASPPGPITGSPRPLASAGSAVDPTAGEIRVLPWGWGMDNIAAAAALASPTDREQIRRTVREDLGAILSCYERARRDDPDLAGVVQTRFIINVDGRTRKVEAHGIDPMLAACLRDLLRSALFPQPATVPLRVDFAFAFSPPVVSEPIADVERPH